MQLNPVIKWTGSKRSQSSEIIKYFPKEIKCYYEPFIGGASVLFQLLRSDIKVEKYICSDINYTLIKLWKDIQENPKELIDSYSTKWHELNKDDDIKRKKEYYYLTRFFFNCFKDSYDFLFLSRTCTNGLIRYNKKGNFNTSFHFSRNGIHPDKLSNIIYEWSELVKDVIFLCQSYEKIKPVKNDFIYLDPPYAKTKGVYYGSIDYDIFWNWLSKQKTSYALSFNGISGEDNNTFEVPKCLYKKHVYIQSGISSFKRMHNKIENVLESLYLNY